MSESEIYKMHINNALLLNTAAKKNIQYSFSISFSSVSKPYT